MRNTDQRGLRIRRLEENEEQNQAKQRNLLLNRERAKPILPWSQSNASNLLYSKRKENWKKLIGKIKNLYLLSSVLSECKKRESNLNF